MAGASHDAVIAGLSGAGTLMLTAVKDLVVAGVQAKRLERTRVDDQLGQTLSRLEDGLNELREHVATTDGVIAGRLGIDLRRPLEGP